MQSARVSSVRVCGLRSQEPESADKTEKKENRFSLSHFHSSVFSSLRKTRELGKTQSHTTLLFYILPCRISQRPITVVGTLCTKRITIDLQWPAGSTTSALQNWNIYFFLLICLFHVSLRFGRLSQVIRTAGQPSLLQWICLLYERCTCEYFSLYSYRLKRELVARSLDPNKFTHTHMNLTHVFTTIAQCKYGSTVGDGRTAYSGVRSRSHRAHKISMPINNTYTTLHTTDRNQSTYKPISENFYFQRDKHNLHIFFYYYYCKFILSFIPYNCQHGILHAVTATPTLDAAVVVTAVDCCC